MQFKVPQNVQREDKIVGPLTLKQLIICGAGGGVAYSIYVTLARNFIWLTWAPPVVIVLLLTAAFAFFRPLDLSFTKWILRWTEHTIIPRQRMWIQSSGDPLPTYISIEKKGAAKEKMKKGAEALTQEDKHKKLEEITQKLNTPNTQE
jgi:hypothetical protein